MEYEGAIYDLIHRGERRGEIFLADPDRRRFLETLTEACQKKGWEVHAYGLMGDHFHLLVETPRRPHCHCTGLTSTREQRGPDSFRRENELKKGG